MDEKKSDTLFLRCKHRDRFCGNMLSKTVSGKTTTFTYDATNQLVSEKSADGKVNIEPSIGKFKVYEYIKKLHNTGRNIFARNLRYFSQI